MYQLFKWRDLYCVGDIAPQTGFEPTNLQCYFYEPENLQSESFQFNITENLILQQLPQLIMVHNPLIRTIKIYIDMNTTTIPVFNIKINEIEPIHA